MYFYSKTYNWEFGEKYFQFSKLTLRCIPGIHNHFWVYDIPQLLQQGAQHLHRGKWPCGHSDSKGSSLRNPGIGAGRSGHTWLGTTAGTKGLCLEWFPHPKRKALLPFLFTFRTLFYDAWKTWIKPVCEGATSNTLI